MSNFQIVDDFEHGIPMTDENMAQFGWVKVVRCRDCKQFAVYKDRHGEDSYWCDWCLACEPDGFCSIGERREP